MNTKKVSLAVLSLGASWFVYYLLFSTSYFPSWTITLGFTGTAYNVWFIVLGSIEMGSGLVAVMRSSVFDDKTDITEKLFLSLIVGGLLGALGFGVSALVLSWPVGSQTTLPTVKLDAQSQSDIEGIINEVPSSEAPESIPPEDTKKKEPDNSPYQ